MEKVERKTVGRWNGVEEVNDDKEGQALTRIPILRLHRISFDLDRSRHEFDADS